jgi:hypothetical protein
VIKSRKLRLEAHVARIGENRSPYRVLVGKSGGRRALVNQGLDGRIISKFILGKWDGGTD